MLKDAPSVEVTPGRWVAVRAHIGHVRRLKIEADPRPPDHIRVQVLGKLVDDRLQVCRRKGGSVLIHTEHPTRNVLVYTCPQRWVGFFRIREARCFQIAELPELIGRQGFIRSPVIPRHPKVIGPLHIRVQEVIDRRISRWVYPADGFGDREGGSYRVQADQRRNGCVSAGADTRFDLGE